MKLLGQLEEIDYALLPIGDNYTMGPADAEMAVEFLQPQVVVPMHYNTFEQIVQDPRDFKKTIEKKGLAKVAIMAPGQEMDITHS